MKPIVFDGCFGWLHPAQGNKADNKTGDNNEVRGAVICNAYGHEGVWSHTGMRKLAENLSARGVAALRFDYRGSGDSIGADGAPDQLDTAVADVIAAIARLKHETGATHITLCGFRLGASLALLASRIHAVDELVLLAPVVNGRSYVRELTVVRKTWFDQLAASVQATHAEGAPLNVLGQVYSNEFKVALSALDPARLLASATTAPAAPIAPASRALIFDLRPNASEPLRTQLEALGVSSECRPFDGYGAFLQEPAFSELPESVFAAVVEWMTNGRAPVAMSPFEWDASLRIDTPDSIEYPVLAGNDKLFGILSKPHRSNANGPILLITNTSASSHVGDSRLSVRIAREMARQGIASLRVDARGIGDSPALPQHLVTASRFSTIYSEHTVDDVAAAATWLQDQGYKDIVSFGICSGAYSAVRAAMISPALAGAVSVNLQSFFLAEGFTPANIAKRELNSVAGYMKSMFQLSRWKRIFSGERSLMPILRLVGGQLVTRVRSRLADFVGDKAPSAAPDARPSDPRSVVNALHRKGVQTLLIYGAYDSGVDLLTAHFGKLGARLSRYPSVRPAIYDDIDHALFSPTASAKVMALTAEFLKGLHTSPRSVASNAAGTVAASASVSCAASVNPAQAVMRTSINADTSDVRSRRI